MNAIFTKLLYEMENGHDTVLCTIIAQSGSTPRGAGAQMLVGADGLLCGTIGGGAIEGQSILLAQSLIPEKHNAVHEYTLRHNDGEDIGMICGGNVTVDFRFIAAGDAAWRDIAAAVLRRIAVRERGYLVLGDTPTLTDMPDTDFFSVPLPIGERAVLFGAGHCSVALSPILQSVGFRVTVLDDRPELADPARFPGADAVICGDFSHISDYVNLSEDDYAVVMTNGHTHDFMVQEQLLRGKAAYIGVIGSRAKTAGVNRRLLEAGISAERIAFVHTPIGTDIKAVTPEEIAISITGEMIAVRAAYREQSGVKLHGCPMH